MPTGMGFIGPKFVKGGRKLKKTKHCTIPSNLVTYESYSNKGEKLSSMCGQLKKEKDTTMKNMQKDAQTLWES